MSDVYSSGRAFRDRIADRLRLQFLSAGNWKVALADSGLPNEVTTIVSEVVQQTKLLRFEKSEIATELIHHFQDGHERGHSFDAIVRDFGETEVAVSLFRSSKLRSRPMSVKAFRGSMIAFSGGLIGYLILLWFFHSAQPNPTVDYGAKLNEAVTSMPIEEQAWPLYRDVWVKYGLVEDGSSYEEFWDDKSRLIRPTDEGWDKAVAKLESLKELLDVLQEGSKLPFVGTPLHADKRKYSDSDLAALFPGKARAEITENGFAAKFGLAINISKEADELMSKSTFGVMLPHIQQFRRAARILRLDTRYAMQQGDTDRAILNVETIFGLGKQAGNSPISVCTLVGLAVNEIGFDTIEELTDEHLKNLSNEDLDRLQKLAANIDSTTRFKDLNFGKDLAMDMIQRIYSDDGNGDGRITAVGMEILNVHKAMEWSNTPDKQSWLDIPIAWPVSLFTAPSRKEMELLVDEAFEEVEKHFQLTMRQELESDFDLEEILDEKDETGFLHKIFGAFVGLNQARETKIARQDAVLLALAIYRFKRDREKWPTKLDQLTDDWIDRTPIDRINGNPLRFTIKEDAPIVYSIGRDGDDDGGVRIDSDTPWLDEESDGDWILWPHED